MSRRLLHGANAWRAADFIPTLNTKEAFDGEGRFALRFAGALFEAYFDPDGKSRRRVKDQALDVLFVLAETREFGEVTAWMRGQLTPCAAHFTLYPGGPRNYAVFEIALDAQARATQIHVAGALVSEPIVPEADGWDGESLPGKGADEGLTNPPYS